MYDYLSELVETKGMKIVATNSYGIPVGAEPPPPEAIFMDALNDAIHAGVVVVFSAGNYHELAGGQALACAPTSIWQYQPDRSAAEVFDVIRGTAVPLGHVRACEGSGMIDCKAALEAA